MAYWIVLTLICCTAGFWLATKYGLDGKAGISLGLSFSILFNAGLYVEFRRYEPSLKLMLIIFILLLCLTFLLLLERHTLIAWLKLAGLTFMLTIVFHEIIPNPTYLQKAETAMNYLSEEAPDIRPLIKIAELQAEAFSARLSKRRNTLVEVRREALLFDNSGDASSTITAGTWGVLSGEKVEENEKTLAGIEILNEEGDVVQTGYLDEEDIGLKVIVPAEEQKQ